MRLFLLFLSHACFANALSPGSEIKIAQSGINKATNSFVDYIHRKFQTISISDQSGKSKGVSYNFWNIVLDQYNIDPNNAGIQLQPNGDIYIHINNIYAHAKADFKLKWKFLHTSGNINAKANGASVGMTVSVTNENGQPRINNKGVSADLGSLDVSVHGSLISWILDLIVDIFKGDLKKMFDREIEKSLNEKVQLLSDRIIKIATQKALGGKLNGFSVGYGLTSNPSVENSALTIPTESQFWFKDHKNEGGIKPSGPYPFGGPSQMVCADIDTNLLFGTFSYAFNVSKLGHFVIDQDIFDDLSPVYELFFECNCKSTFGCLTGYIPQLKAHCPPGGKIKIESTAEIQESLYFNNSGIFSLASGTGSYIAVAPDKTETVLFDMKADVGLNLMQNVTFKDWTLKGTVQVFYTKLSAHSDLFGDIDIKILDKMWNFVLKVIAEKVANDYLESGLPLPQLDFATFTNTKLQFSGQFMRFCTDIDVTWDKILN